MNPIILLQYPFIQQAFAAGIAIAALCAVLGLFLVLKNMSFIGDGLSHISFGAIALGLFLGIFPLYIALPFTLISSWLILLLSQTTKMYSDAAIAVISTLGMAIGVILVSISHGLNLSLFSYLFGSILTITATEVWLTLIFSAAALAVIMLFYNELFYVVFDAECAKTAGINVGRINLLLVSITALAVVLAIRVVGVLLTLAILVIPPITALQIGRSFKQTLMLSVAIGIFSMAGGILVSLLLDWPTGATIVVVNFAVFCAAITLKKIAAS